MPDGTASPAEPVDDPHVRAALRDATRPLSGLDHFSARATLDNLMKGWAFTGIDVYEDSIFRNAESYFAPATIYVSVGSPSARVTGTSFPGRILFEVSDDGSVAIHDITADAGETQLVAP
jgi:hypothetical protein